MKLPYYVSLFRWYTVGDIFRGGAMATSNEGGKSDAVIVASRIWFVAGGAAVGLLSYAWCNRQDFFAIMGTGFLVSIASLVIGGLAGFLFGIPKSGQAIK